MTGCSGDVLVVTGSTSGVGLALATLGLERGMRVVVNGRTAEKVGAAQERLGVPDRVLGVAADLRDPAQAARLVAETVDRFGRIDLWVNNAAGLFFAPAQDITPGGWRAILGTNLDAAFFCCRGVLPVLRR